MKEATALYNVQKREWSVTLFDGTVVSSSVTLTLINAVEKHGYTLVRMSPGSFITFRKTNAVS